MNILHIKLLKLLGVSERITRQRAIAEIKDALLNNEAMMEALLAERKALQWQLKTHYKWLDKNIPIPDEAQELRNAEGLDYQMEGE